MDDDMDADTLDRPRDVIDVASPAEQHLAQHAAYCRALVAQRCPELSDDDITSPAKPFEDDLGASVWLQVAEQVLDALDEVSGRLERIEAMVTGR
jgi:hypothetical protein